jgi:hypothetical protein
MVKQPAALVSNARPPVVSKLTDTSLHHKPTAVETREQTLSQSTNRTNRPSGTDKVLRLAGGHIQVWSADTGLRGGAGTPT